MACYLVTGGCGFIGTHLVRKLCDNGHEVIVIDDLSAGYSVNLHAKASLIEADICNLESYEDQIPSYIDGCYHLAANPSATDSMANYLKTHKINLGGTLAVFDWASRMLQKQHKVVKVVYASSCAVYGANHVMPLSEISDQFPLNGYGADKKCGEIHARMVALAYGVKSLGLRFFNVYGPGQNATSSYSGVLSIFCKALSSGQKITIFGDGEQVRDFIFIDDVVEALISAMSLVNSQSPGVVNVCSGNGTTLLNVGEIVADLCGVKFSPSFSKERIGDIKISIGDPKLCFKLLGWRHSTDLKEGLSKTIQSI